MFSKETGFRLSTFRGYFFDYRLIILSSHTDPKPRRPYLPRIYIYIHYLHLTYKPSHSRSVLTALTMASNMDELMSAVKAIHTNQAQLLSTVESISRRVGTLEHSLAGGKKGDDSTASDSESPSRSFSSTGLATSGLAKSPSLMPVDAETETTGRASPITKSGFTSRIILTTYPKQIGINPLPMHWGASDPLRRGPVVVSRSQSTIRRRNAIGAHGGSYSIYYALALASKELRSDHRPDFTNTEPAVDIGPFPQWCDPKKIVAMDPWGHLVPWIWKDTIEKENGISHITSFLPHTY